ncbi:MAG: translation elongation factor Ts [Candidatus Omnitrophica bacterium]|nr:translation elongation factor Ts [Candidatus Omnitrophota bacterium]
MKITAQDIQKLRGKTGVGVMDCKQALQESKGDFEQAIKLLRKKGVAIAAKKSAREAREGRIEAYVHLHNKIGVLVEVNCETDFVCRNEEFIQFTRDLAMQIAALEPSYLKKEDVPAAVAKEHKDGLDEFYQSHCLLEQAFIKDDQKTIGEYLTELIAKTGENIVVRRFTRFQLGE